TEARRSSKRWLLVREHRKPKWSLMRQPGEARRGPEKVRWLGRLASHCGPRLGARNLFEVQAAEPAGAPGQEHVQQTTHAGGGGLPNPMHQFEIKRIIPLDLFGFDASFTNSALFMVIAGTTITLFTIFAMRNRALVPSRVQSVAELSYEFVARMVRDTVGTAGMKYFPFVFRLFMFVLVLNMLGMVPYSFTVTSHIIITFALAAFIFLGVTLIGFIKHGAKFLKFFVPEGVPLIML